MVHSGSRNTGLRIANYYNQLAIDVTRHRGLPVGDDLASLPLDDQLGQEYLEDMAWATDFALENRRRMMDQMAEALALTIERHLPRHSLDDFGEDVDFINVHHNFAQLEVHGGRQIMVHRKGATSAYEGQLGIIPGSTGSNSYIVRGHGNEDSLKSCSHGAGRRMGRNVAKKTITQAQFAASLDGAYSKPSMTYVHEAPAAYKDIETVIGRQTDLVEIVHTLKPIITVKGIAGPKRIS